MFVYALCYVIFTAPIQFLAHQIPFTSISHTYQCHIRVHQTSTCKIVSSLSTKGACWLFLVQGVIVSIDHLVLHNMKRMQILLKVF